MGEVVDRNAHPFQHGSITLVHNGTLDNQSLLPDHQKFAVDSENIAYSIDKIGIEETIKKLNGKFTLVWFDAKDQTLNFIRNKDRPFHFMETSSGDWFGASEEDMLMWLSKRTKGPTAKRHFEAEVGVQYVFEIANGVFRFKEERKHELPVFRYVYTSGYLGTGRNSIWDSNDDDDGWDRYLDRRYP
ncbi:class II glutamine amidotransferase, partial [Herbiconiux daphne]